ncbi:MAG: YceI family protein [Candidatus Dormibacteraeota bacterium]|nr:YceI family protein [Candidatus Dormibacteraeota bacterium]
MKWAIDPNHSAATFTIRHMMSKVRGQIKIKEGWIEAENDHTTATVDVTLDTASINTGVEARDNHLRSADGHFDVENYPVATFKSKRIEGKDPKQFKIVGDLTLHGITKEITLDAHFGGEGTDPWGNRRVSFSAETKLNRKDFDLTWNQALEAGGFILGDDVKVELEVEAVPAQKPAEAKEKIAAEAAAESR